jgi:predicted metal-dependent hydrolase
MSSDPRAGSRSQLRVAELEIEVVRKAIKNLHISVHPPHGRIRAAAPLAMSQDAVRRAVVTRLGWIKRQRAAFVAQSRSGAPEFVSGESHWLFGRRYRLVVEEHDSPVEISIRGGAKIRLRCRPGLSAAGRARALDAWYRERLEEVVGPMFEQWCRRLGVDAREFRIKRMRTKWGSCSVRARRIWLNVELARRPQRCIEYLVVHELVHLLEPSHGPNFVSLMDRYLPTWRRLRALLNEGPLAHQDWVY